MELLGKLQDIHYPAPVSLWPLAFGWIILFCMICFGTLLSIYLYIRYQRKIYAKKIILQRLAVIRNNEFSSEVNIFEELSMLLKRAALYAFPREKVAGLCGESWLQFLDSTSDQDHLFSKGMGNMLISAPYQAEVHGSVIDLVVLIEAWVMKNL